MGYNREEVNEARKTDLLSYLLQYAPQELVHVAGNTYCTREHDSLKISNGKWYWFSRGIGGRSALDYLIKVKGIPFLQAVEMILGRAATEPSVFHPRESLAEEKMLDQTAGESKKQASFGEVMQSETRLPEAAESPDVAEAPVFHTREKPTEKKLLLPELREDYPSRAVHYLEARGVNREILDYCVHHKLLFETKQYHNAVFVGYDKGGVIRYAAMRATKGPFKGEATGSDKHFSFFLAPDPGSSRVHVFESAIDLLSYATMEKLAGRDWERDALLSLAGVFKQKREKVVPVALRQFLNDHPAIHSLELHLDNDQIGRSAAKGIVEGLSGEPYTVTDHSPKYGKDMNDQLLWQLATHRKEYER